MLLSDRDIKAAMGLECHGGESKKIFKNAWREELRITPYNPAQLQPASYDLRLGDVCAGPRKGEWVSAKFGREAGMATAILPQGFLLAHTEEVIHLPDWLAARVEGKSSIARKGLFAHTSAGWIDPGFHGQITLELFNASSEPIRLKPGDLISQVSFYLLSSPAEKPYKGHYQGQMGATRSWLDESPPEAVISEEVYCPRCWCWHDAKTAGECGFKQAEEPQGDSEWSLGLNHPDFGKVFCGYCEESHLPPLHDRTTPIDTSHHGEPGYLCDNFSCKDCLYWRAAPTSMNARRPISGIADEDLRTAWDLMDSDSPNHEAAIEKTIAANSIRAKGRICDNANCREEH